MSISTHPAISTTDTTIRTAVIPLFAISAIWFLCLAWSVQLTPQAFVFADEAGYLLPSLFGGSAENYERWGDVMRYPSPLYFLFYAALPADHLYFYARLLNCFFIAATAAPAFLIGRKFVSPTLATIFAIFVILSPASSYARFMMPESMYFFGFWCCVAVTLSPVTKGRILNAVIAGACVGLLANVKTHALGLAIGLALYTLIERPSKQSLLSAFALLASMIVTWKLTSFLLTAGSASGSSIGSYSGVFGGSINWSAFARNLSGHVLAVGTYCGLLVAFALRTAFNRKDPLFQLAIAALAILGALIAMTTLFSQAVFTMNPEIERISRLHGRYYLYPFPLFVLLGIGIVSRKGWDIKYRSFAPLAVLVPFCSLAITVWFEASRTDFPDISLIGAKASPYYLSLAVILCQAVLAGLTLSWASLTVPISLFWTSAFALTTTLAFTFVAPWSMPVREIDTAFVFQTNPALQKLIGRDDGIVLAPPSAGGDLQRTMFYLRSLSYGAFTGSNTIADSDIPANKRWAILLPDLRYVGAYRSEKVGGLTVVEVGPRTP